MLPAGRRQLVRFKRVVPVGRECDPLAVRRPRGPKCALEIGGRGRERLTAGEVAQLVRGQVERPDVRRVSAAGRDEGELATVGRDDALIFEVGIVGQPLEAGPVRVHAVEIGLA